MKHQRYNPNHNFVKKPVEYDNFTDRDFLQYCPVATLYIPGLRLLEDMPQVQHCYSYFPELIDEEKFVMSRDALFEKLKEHNIYHRRYFYPLISQFPTYRGLESAQPEKLTMAQRIMEEVICLPIYPELSIDHLQQIRGIIKRINL